jgi:hypothetical protein
VLSLVEKDFKTVTAGTTSSGSGGPDVSKIGVFFVYPFPKDENDLNTKLRPPTDHPSSKADGPEKRPK